MAVRLAKPSLVTTTGPCRVARDHIHGQQAVVVTELHALHAGGLAAHRAQLLVVGLELEAHAEFGDQDDVVLGVAQRGADQLVGVLAVLVGHEAHGDQAALARESYSASGVFLTLPERVASTRYLATS